MVAGFFIVLFSTYFFLADGGRIWAWAVRLAPRAAREAVDSSGRVAWVSLTQFVRATVIVALVDSIGIMIVAAILGVPFVLAIGVLVFLGSFIPMVGATIAGTVAVLVALVDQGPITALLMLGGVILIQQIEGHILQPFLMGRWVSVHPLGVIVAIGCGVLVAGIAGALVAVPLAAAVNAVVQHLANFSSPGDDPVEELHEDYEELGEEPPTEESGSMSDLPTVTLADIEEAREVLRGVAVQTPMEESRWLSALAGGPVSLKCENLQRTGSFKTRGAYMRISRLSEEERAHGVVAASAGNHAQGVALAAQLLGIKATVFMPEGAPIPKEKATRAYGADVIFHGRYLEDALRGRAGVLGGDRGGAHPPLRPPRHRGRAGHRAGSRSSSRHRTSGPCWCPPAAAACSPASRSRSRRCAPTSASSASRPRTRRPTPPRSPTAPRSRWSR